MPVMISLIINADDLGSNQQRDRGILEAYRQGIVTSASVLANGPSFTAAVAIIKESGLPVGVHLNLSDGPTLTGCISGLTDIEGCLPGKQKLRQYLSTGICDHTAIRNELAAQIERLFDNGLCPDHLDGHQHCHLFPALTAVVIDLAKRYAIPAMRTSLPAECDVEDPEEGQLADELSLYRRLSQEAHTKTIDAGITVTDGLWGMPTLNHMDTSNLCRILKNLPDGRWELMTHPGFPYDLGSPFDGPQRLVELQALVSPEAERVVEQRGIRLCSFGDL